MVAAGDQRGFVSPVWDERAGRHVLHNSPGVPVMANQPSRAAAARQLLVGDPVRLTAAQAALALEQFHETSRLGDGRLLAAAVMSHHVHLVVGVAGDPDPARLLQSYKAFASRRLNAEFTRPTSGTWWAESGSRRKLPNERAVRAAVRYVAR